MKNLSILASLLLIISNTSAQVSSEFWITVRSDSIPWEWKLWFGNHVDATYGIDSLNPTLIEKCFPPSPPGFEVAWMDLPGRSRGCDGAGLIIYDFRGIPTNFPQLDTFIIGFYNFPEYPDFTFHWPASTYLADRSDSMFLVDVTGQIPTINMFDVDSLIIEDAEDKNIHKLRIYKYGCKIIDNVYEGGINIPVVFGLNQNYPNPFNPSTQITYSMPKTTEVTLKVYDLLGREVALLVNERKLAGEYNVTWNAVGIPSGVYFYRIVAGEYTLTKKMVVMK